MKVTSARVLACLLLGAGIGIVPAALEAASVDAVLVAYTLLVGSPEAGPDEAGTVLIVPGTVVLSEPEVSRYSEDVEELSGKLRATYRLGTLEAVAATRTVAILDSEQAMPVAGSDLGVLITLLGCDNSFATFKVRFTEAGKTIAEPVVSVKMSGRAVIATRDGPSAPYAFVLLSPNPRPEGKGIEVPRVVEQVRPAYPEGARKAKVRGVVILEGVVGKDGRLHEIKTLRSLPEGLTEAAIDAFRQWRFEPARNATGEPVAVKYAVNFNFWLQ